MIIIDSSHAIIAATARASKDFGIDGVKVSDVRSYFFMLVANVKKKFGGEYGNEVVFAFDSEDGYWRKDVFPYYKIKRKDAHANAPFSFDFAKECINILFDELNTTTHYKAVRVSKAEGDDIIASIVKNKCPLKGEIVDRESQERVMVISSDGDLVQLQQYQGVDQYSTTLEKYVRSENPKFALFEKIVRGDAGDSIPSSLTQDDHYALVEKKRQKSIFVKNIDEWWKEYDDTGVINENISTYYSRNKQLIDFDEIPVTLEKEIVIAYDQSPVQSKTDFLNYVTKNTMNSVFDQIQFL